MGAQFLIPSVQHGRKSDLAIEFLTTKLQEGLCCGLKQQIQQRTLIVFTPTNERI